VGINIDFDSTLLTDHNGVSHNPKNVVAGELLDLH